MKKKELLKIVRDEEIGEIKIFRNSNTRSIRITIKQSNDILLNIPDFMSYEKALRFIEQKRQWIKKSQMKLIKRAKNQTFFSENSQFNTKDHHLKLGRHSKSTIRTVIKKGEILVEFPDFADINDTRVQQAIRKAIVTAWSLEAKKYLPEMVKYLAGKYKLQYGKVTVRNNKTRWGSCSKGDNISLNIHLIRLPEHLCEYVILHELGHTINKHHQKAFWELLDQMTGGRARKLDKELNNYSPEIW